MFGFRHRTKTANRQCSHAKALPRWDHVDETGDPARVSRFYCPDCDRFVEPAQRQGGENEGSEGVPSP
jgi:ketosteroid isomerase-like protein